MTNKKKRPSTMRSGSVRNGLRKLDSFLSKKVCKSCVKAKCRKPWFEEDDSEWELGRPPCKLGRVLDIPKECQYFMEHTVIKQKLDKQ
jgi:hypothetical protein